MLADAEEAEVVFVSPTLDRIAQDMKANGTVEILVNYHWKTFVQITVRAHVLTAINLNDQLFHIVSTCC